MPESPALKIDDLSASWFDHNQRVPVLRDISLELNTGEIVAILGPSGSGKSTLLDIVSGLLEPDKGMIALDEIPARAPQRLGRSAYMRQRDLLFPWRTALENAALALEIQGRSRRDATNIAMQRFGEFGLSGAEKLYPAQLSGGMRQRVAFLRTMLAGQDLLLLDEPFGALDALTRLTMQNWLAELLVRDPHSVLFVTHDVQEAIVLADRVLVFSPQPGSIIHEELISQPRPRPATFAVSDLFVKHEVNLFAALGMYPQAVAHER